MRTAFLWLWVGGLSLLSGLSSWIKFIKGVNELKSTGDSKECLKRNWYKTVKLWKYLQSKSSGQEVQLVFILM